MKDGNRRQILILSFALAVVTLGFGLIIPIFPFYVEALGASGRHLGLLVATAALLEFVFAPLWGSVSDRTGRKPILIVGMIGYALSSLLFGLSTRLWMLFVSRALSGVLSSAATATAMAYVSDSTSDERRGGGLGILGAASGLGMILGPGIGGWLGSTALSLPFYVAAGMALVALVLIALLLPESLPPEARQHGTGGLATVQVRTLWASLWSPVGLLLFMLFLVSFGLTNFESVFGLYAADRYGYGPERVGVILVVIGIVSTVGKATLIGPLTRWWGEALIVKVSLIASSVGFLVLLMAQQYPLVLLATGLFVLSKTLLRTAVLSLISKRTSAGQGASMGLGNSFISLGRIVGPIWAGFIYDVDLSYPYMSGAAVMFAGFLVALAWIRQPAPRGKGVVHTAAPG
ncbi:MAG: MFS transporter [Anaerolineae bacterium]|nr:MFS transporter [Anaerolineae bacterium]